MDVALERSAAPARTTSDQTTDALFVVNAVDTHTHTHTRARAHTHTTANERISGAALDEAPANVATRHHVDEARPLLDTVCERETRTETATETEIYTLQLLKKLWIPPRAIVERWGSGSTAKRRSHRRGFPDRCQPRE